MRCVLRSTRCRNTVLLLLLNLARSYAGRPDADDIYMLSARFHRAGTAYLDSLSGRNGFRQPDGAVMLPLISRNSAYIGTDLSMVQSSDEPSASPPSTSQDETSGQVVGSVTDSVSSQGSMSRGHRSSKVGPTDNFGDPHDTNQRAPNITRNGEPVLLAWNWSTYPSVRQVAAFLYGLQLRSKGACNVYPIGESVLGEPLLVVAVAANTSVLYTPDGLDPSTDLDGSVVQYPKPIVTFIGTIHGDETAQLLVMMRWAEELCLAAVRTSGTNVTNPIHRASGNGAVLAGVDSGSSSSKGREDATAPPEDLERLLNLIHITRLFVLPLFNPDGYAAGTRANANDVDLNRNWLDPSFPFNAPRMAQLLRMDEEGTTYIRTDGVLHFNGNGTHPPTKHLGSDRAQGVSGTGSRRPVSSFQAAAQYLLDGTGPLQPENLALRAWLRAFPPQLSANSHGGFLTANYVLDACDSLGADMDCPGEEGDVPAFLANMYSQNHLGGMQRGSDGRSFVNGTTQGARWYTVLGSLQDWLYHSLQVLHTTLELHFNKQLAAGPDLALVYHHNRLSLMRYAESAHAAVRAYVYDARSMAPLAVNVSVLQPNTSQLTTPAGYDDSALDETVANLEAGNSVDDISALSPALRGAAAAQTGQFMRMLSYPGETRLPLGHVHRLLVPGVRYQLQLQPFDPENISLLYRPVLLDMELPLGWDAAVQGTGLIGLSYFTKVAAERV